MKTKTKSIQKFKQVRIPTDPIAKSVKFDKDYMYVYLTDGRTLSVPLIWFPLLEQATPKQRERYELGGGGASLHWPEIDEDISVSILMTGRCL